MSGYSLSISLKNPGRAFGACGSSSSTRLITELQWALMSLPTRSVLKIFGAMAVSTPGPACAEAGQVSPRRILDGKPVLRLTDVGAGVAARQLSVLCAELRHCMPQVQSQPAETGQQRTVSAGVGTHCRIWGGRSCSGLHPSAGMT